MRLPRNAAAFSVSGQVTDMKYINDKPIDFTNDDWKQYTPRERARLEQQEQKQRKQKVRKKRSLPVRIFTALFQALVVVLIAYVLVYTVGQQRTIVGQSMDTTLAGGAVVLINVMSYQVGSPKRGDLVSYRPNGSSNARADIKRVIGLPGDKIQIKDGQVYIDDQVYLEDGNYPAITNPGIAKDPIELDEGEYFLLGDNRNNSEDSRNTEIGLVSSSMIEGKVWFVLSPASHRRFI